MQEGPRRNDAVLFLQDDPPKVRLVLILNLAS